MTIAQQIFWIIIGAAVLGGYATYLIMIAVGYSRHRYNHSKEWLKERYDKQSSRARWIQKWASDQMSTVPLKLRKEDRMVLVSYKDLLSVWDLSDKIWMDLSE